MWGREAHSVVCTRGGFRCPQPTRMKEPTHADKEHARENAPVMRGVRGNGQQIDPEKNFGPRGIQDNARKK